VNKDPAANKGSHSPLISLASEEQSPDDGFKPAKATTKHLHHRPEQRQKRRGMAYLEISPDDSSASNCIQKRDGEKKGREEPRGAPSTETSRSGRKSEL
jgi:hypothetical protein